MLRDFQPRWDSVNRQEELTEEAKYLVGLLAELERHRSAARLRLDRVLELLAPAPQEAKTIDLRGESK